MSADTGHQQTAFTSPPTHTRSLVKAVLSVVIPAFNAERTLAAVLAALAADPERPDEVIVVDDRSTDRTAEIARAHGARGDHVGYAGGAAPLWISMSC